MFTRSALTSLICVEGHQTAAGFDVVALRSEASTSYISNPALDRKKKTSLGTCCEILHRFSEMSVSTFLLSLLWLADKS